MIKNSLYPILFIAILSLASCSSNDKADFKLEGKWHIYERIFTCSDATIQKRVNNILLPNYMKEGSNTYFEFDYEDQSGKGLYKENFTKWIIITEGKDSIQETARYYSGDYTADYDKGVLSANINSLGSGNWVTTNAIRDLNNKHIHLVQEMNNEDIERFMEVYFTAFGESVPEGVTAMWSAKAIKE